LVPMFDCLKSRHFTNVPRLIKVTEPRPHVPLDYHSFLAPLVASA